MLHTRQVALCLCLVLASSLVWGQTNYVERWQGTTYAPVLPSSQRPPSVLVRNITAEPYTWIFNVVFWDDQIGWAAGFGGVFATTDGGYSWKRMRPRGGWRGLGLTGPREVWIVGEAEGMPLAVWHSTDAGATWQPALTNQLLHPVYLLCAGREIWAPSQNGILHSADNGATWKEEPIGSWLKVAIPGDRPTPGGFVVYATGFHGAELLVLKSEDSGKTWMKLSTPSDLSIGGREGSRPLFFVNSDTGWIGGNHGDIIYTSDGGKTWSHRDLPTKRLVTALWFDQLGRGYAAISDNDYSRVTEPDVLYQTQDGGRTWTSALRNEINVLGFCDRGPGRVWAVGVTRNNMPEGIVVFLAAPSARAQVPLP
jgi:photosystem II stability/assembly factor-like uncharacterized protein